MPRRISLLVLALASLALGACADATAPVGTDTICATGAVTNGTHTKC